LGVPFGSAFVIAFSPKAPSLTLEAAFSANPIGR
jgi:hypothetical protein